MRATIDTNRAHGALLQTKLRRALEQVPDGALAVAFSGGPDSTALLHALAALPEARARGLHALHVDHGLHPQSGDWARHCLAQCAALNVPCRVLPAVVANASGSGLEAAARHARYAALAAALQPGERLLTAHHRDDQAETFLLRALRASGPDGLAAMRALRRFGPGWLWRPVLDLPRQALLDYLAEHALPYIVDPANADPRHDRNWLRHHLLPELRRRWPQAEAILARSAALCAEASELLAGEDRHALAQARQAQPEILRIAALQALPPARRARVLRQWLSDLDLPPLPAHGIARIESDLLPARPDAQAEFAWSGAVVRRWRDRLYAEPHRDPLPQAWSADWDGREPLTLPTGDRLRLRPIAAPATPPPAFAPPLTVRPRYGGERIRLPGRTHTHPLKHALQEAAIPPWQRERLPLLFAPDGELLAAGDRVLSARMDVWLHKHAARLVWCH